MERELTLHTEATPTSKHGPFADMHDRTANPASPPSTVERARSAVPRVLNDVSNRAQATKLFGKTCASLLAYPVGEDNE
jgi:hypothetical protein